ncbi:oligosaccharide flippase family protein [Patescibacteria group bacterium]|nr:oligosaccharide flippase family protein [Patescibacteria group bacterium]
MRNKIYNLLRWSEKYTKTDTLYLTKSGYWLSIGHGVAILSGLLLSIAFANFFPKESFGTYKFVLSMIGILGAFSLTGMGTAITQSVARGFGNALRRGFKINLKWSVVVFFGGLLLSAYYYINGNTLLSISFLLAGTLSPIIASTNLYSAYLIGKKDFKRNSFYSMVRNIAPAIAIIVALFLTDSLLIILTVYFFSGAIISLFLYRATTHHYQNDDNEEDRELTSYSGHLSVMGIVGQITNHLDKILIFHFLGAVPLAIYAFAIAPVNQLQAGKKILSKLVLPKLSERSFEELQKSTPRKALLLTVYALVLAGVYVLLAPYFYKFLFPQYLDSVFYSQIYSLTLLAISGTMFNETLVAHKKKKELYLHRTIVPTVQIVLFFILLPLFGLMGLIVTHVIIRSFSGILGYYFVKHPIGN